jgi:hypothetical protein
MFFGTAPGALFAGTVACMIDEPGDGRERRSLMFSPASFAPWRRS